MHAKRLMEVAKINHDSNHCMAERSQRTDPGDNFRNALQILLAAETSKKKTSPYDFMMWKAVNQ